MLGVPAEVVQEAHSRACAWFLALTGKKFKLTVAHLFAILEQVSNTNLLKGDRYAASTYNGQRYGNHGLH